MGAHLKLYGGNSENKIMQGFYVKVLITAGLLIIATGCRTKQGIITDTIPYEKTEISEITDISSVGKRGFVTAKYKNIEGQIIINGIPDNIRGNLGIYRDSLLVMSVVPVLGYEMIRILCTPDSVIIINRNEKNYIASSFKRYCEKYSIPFTFYDLQAIISNELFFYKGKIKNRTYKDSLDAGENKTSFIKEAFIKGEKITSQTIQFDAENLQLQEVAVTDYENRIRMYLKYADFRYDGNISFPQKVEIKLFQTDNTLEIELNYRQVVFDEAINIEFETPKNYTQIDI